MSQRRSNKGDPTRAVAYLRVSPSHLADAAERQKSGLETQQGTIARWAAEKQLVVVATFIDQDISGATPMEGRPGLQAALSALREHRAGVLLAQKRDRFFREPESMEELKRLTNRKGAVIRTADGTSEESGYVGEVQRASMDFAAKLERLTIRDRRSSGLKAMLAAGKAPGGNPPFGWKIVKTLDDKKGWVRTLEECPEEQAALALMLELDAQNLSWAEMARRLTEAGYKPRGAKWHPRNIETVLRRFKTSVRPGGRTDSS